MSTTRNFWPTLAFALALACSTGGDATTADSAAGATEGAGVSVDESMASDTGLPNVVENHINADIQLTGGGGAGSYALRSGDGVCSEPRFTSEDDASAGTYTPMGQEPPASPGNVAVVSVSTMDLAAARRGGTDNFEFRVVAASKDGRRHDLFIRPKKQNGSGTVTVSGEAPLLTFKVKGKAGDGTAVDATITCLR